MSDMPVSRVFTNDLLQKEFDRKGYVLLRSLLSAEEIKKLNDLTRNNKGYKSGSNSSSK